MVIAGRCPIMERHDREEARFGIRIASATLSLAVDGNSKLADPRALAGLSHLGFRRKAPGQGYYVGVEGHLLAA
jgi:hypothetical protein